MIPFPAPIRKAALTAAVASCSLIDPNKLGTLPGIVYRLGSSALGAWMLAEDPEVKKLDTDPFRFGPPLSRPQIALMGGAATLGLIGPSIALDGKITQWLQAHGLKNPRPLYAAISVASLLPILRAKDPEPAAIFDGEGTWCDEASSREAFPREKALIEALLATPPSGRGISGAPALRAQLEVATVGLPVPSDDAEGSSDLAIYVPENVDRVVPFRQTWPVAGVFTLNGVEMEMRLSIEDGRLSLIGCEMTCASVSDETEVADMELTEVFFADQDTMVDPEALTIRVDGE